MKFLVAFVAVVAVAVASPLKAQKPATSELAELEAIIAAIQSPSTDPATAALLEQQLQEILGVRPEPVIIAPEVAEYEPIAVGPAIIDFPLPDGGALTVPDAVIEPAPVVVEPSPVVIGDLEAGQSPLVQIIVNVNAGSAPAPSPVLTPSPAVVPEIKPEPVIVVDQAPVEPVIIVDTPIVVEPVQVAEPVIVEPVVIGTPIIPAPAVVLPEELN